MSFWVPSAAWDTEWVFERTYYFLIINWSKKCFLQSNLNSLPLNQDENHANELEFKKTLFLSPLYKFFGVPYQGSFYS